jgi:hypothetical protein
VEHLHADFRLAVFDEIPIRHLIHPSFRHASKERSEAVPWHFSGFGRAHICSASRHQHQELVLRQPLKHLMVQ